MGNDSNDCEGDEKQDDLRSKGREIYDDPSETKKIGNGSLSLRILID